MGAGVGREGGARGARLWRAGRSAEGEGDAAVPRAGETPQQAICRSKGAERVKGR